MQKKDNYLLSFPISLRASLPSLSVLVTNQESNIMIKKVSNNNDINVRLYNFLNLN